ncbi:MAG TPA: flavoprotein [Actinoplanes sp.]|nr:flavoprotein [Actinoplanes sp.]
MTAPADDKTLLIIICGAGPAPHAGRLISLANKTGWTTRVIATAAAVKMVNVAALEAFAGSPVRTDFNPNGRGTGAASSSSADALIIAPATYNTINKLAGGVNDSYPLNIVAEALGRRTPTAILPFVNTALAARRPFLNAVADLRSEGAKVLFGPGQWMPHPPGTGGAHLDSFPWGMALEAINQAGPIGRPNG